MRLVGFLGIFLVIGCEPGGAPLRTTEHAGSKLPVAPIFVSPAPPPARDAKGPPPTKRRAEKRYALRELSTEAPAALGAAIPVPQRVYRTDCEKPAPMHGFFRGEPVVATFGVRGDRLTLALESITSKTTMKFRGRSKGNVCGGPSFAFEGRAGRIEKIDRGEPAKLNVEIFLPDSFEDVRDDVGSITVTRSRLKIEGRDATRPDDLALELWEVAEDPQKVLEPYRAALRTAADIDAIVKLTDETTLVAYADAGSRRITLAELGGSPLSVKRSTATGLVGVAGDESTARLASFELGSATVAVLVVLEGSGSRGQGNFDTAQAELFVLTPKGFTQGAKLPTAQSSSTAHGAVNESTALHWVDGDGKHPPEILALHDDWSAETLAGTERYPGWDKRTHELFAFDPTLEAYQKVEAPPEVPPEMLKSATSGAFASF